MLFMFDLFVLRVCSKITRTFLLVLLLTNCVDSKDSGLVVAQSVGAMSAFFALLANKIIAYKLYAAFLNRP